MSPAQGAFVGTMVVAAAGIGVRVAVAAGGIGGLTAAIVGDFVTVAVGARVTVGVVAWGPRHSKGVLPSDRHFSYSVRVGATVGVLVTVIVGVSVGVAFKVDVTVGTICPACNLHEATQPLVSQASSQDFKSNGFGVGVGVGVVLYFSHCAAFPPLSIHSRYDLGVGVSPGVGFGVAVIVGVIFGVDVLAGFGVGVDGYGPGVLANRRSSPSPCSL